MLFELNKLIDCLIDSSIMRRRNRKLQFSDRQLHISDRRSWRPNFSNLPLNSPKIQNLIRMEIPLLEKFRGKIKILSIHISCVGNLSDRGDLGARNFNFVPKFQQYGDGTFPVPAWNFIFLEDNLPTKRKFPGRLKFRGRRVNGGNCPFPPPASLPRRVHCVPVRLPRRDQLVQRDAAANVPCPDESSDWTCSRFHSPRTLSTRALQ